MPIASIKFRPGINTTYTPTLNEGGWSACNLIRFVGGLPQKIGGWTKYWPFSVGSAIRAMNIWDDFNATTHLAVGAASSLSVITDGNLTDITPQQLTSDFAPDIETTSASPTVSITDPNIADVTIYDTVYFNTPVSVGGLILSGHYPITLTTSSTSYQITASSNATATVSTIAITGATQANPCVVTAVAHGRSTGDYVYIDGVVGMTQINGGIYQITVATADTFSLDGIDSSAYTAYSSGGFVYGGIVPQFSVISGSTEVAVTLPDHGLTALGRITFGVSTTVGGITILGTYQVVSVTNADTFVIAGNIQASLTATAIMNSGECELIYYIALGPAPAGAGYGLGTYGTGGYGTGVVPAAQTGTPITATNWTLDTWGQTLLACPEGGGIYAWDPDEGFETAKLIATEKAPLFNAGIFVAQPAQILVAYGSTTQNVADTIGVYQDPLLVRWSNLDDYTDWSISTTDQVGSVRLSSGSSIIGGIQGPNQALLWTDVGVWSMQYSGQPLVFGFNEIGAGCGLIAKHAMAILQEQVFWMGLNNFYAIAGSGVTPIPCPVWDDVFQDLDTANQSKCWAWAVATYSEVWFFYPSIRDGTGECTRYAKLSIAQPPVWDVGELPRSAGIDQSVVNYPLAGTSTGLVYQHEDGQDADGQPISSWVQSADVMIAEGNDCMFLDQIRPDMKYEFVSGSSTPANMTITVTIENDYTGEVMTSGALPYDEDTKYMTTRLRGHRTRFKIASDDNGSWWRLGLMRYRAARDGRN